MNPEPNLAGLWRFGYVAAGIALIAWALFYADPGTGRLIACFVGTVALIEGLIGYCPIVAKLGVGGSKPGEAR